MTIIIVTGERDWTDRETIFRVLDEEFRAFVVGSTGDALTKEFVLRHGVAPGADSIANEWGLNRGITIERFPAKWNDHTGYHPEAGPVRNTLMARTEPRAVKCIAFWSGKMRKRTNGREFSGTLDMMKTALLHQIPLRVEPPKDIT